VYNVFTSLSIVCIDAEHTGGFRFAFSAPLYYPEEPHNTWEYRNPTDNQFPVLQARRFSWAEQSGDPYFLNIVLQR